MQSVIDRLIERIKASQIDPNPSENIYLEDVFTAEIYKEILTRLPDDDDYHFIEHPDAILPDGTKTRKLLDLTDETILMLKPWDQDFWRQMKNVFTSKELLQAITQKFHERIQKRFGETWPEMITVPIFYRDYPGYFISPHTDAPFKIATMQFYFPSDMSQIHLGTSFLQKEPSEFRVLKTNQFKPNSAYAFVRTDESWHAVKRMAVHERKRNSLALTIYEKGKEYNSSKVYL